MQFKIYLIFFLIFCNLAYRIQASQETDWRAKRLADLAAQREQRKKQEQEAQQQESSAITKDINKYCNLDDFSNIPDDPMELSNFNDKFSKALIPINATLTKLKDDLIQFTKSIDDIVKFGADYEKQKSEIKTCKSDCAAKLYKLIVLLNSQLDAQADVMKLMNKYGFAGINAPIRKSDSYKNSKGVSIQYLGHDIVINQITNWNSEAISDTNITGFTKFLTSQISGCVPKVQDIAQKLEDKYKRLQDQIDEINKKLKAEGKPQIKSTSEIVTQLAISLGIMELAYKANPVLGVATLVPAINDAIDDFAEKMISFTIETFGDDFVGIKDAIDKKNVGKFFLKFGELVLDATGLGIASKLIAHYINQCLPKPYNPDTKGAQECINYVLDKAQKAGEQVVDFMYCFNYAPVDSQKCGPYVVDLANNIKNMGIAIVYKIEGVGEDFGKFGRGTVEHAPEAFQGVGEAIKKIATGGIFNL